MPKRIIYISLGVAVVLAAVVVFTMTQPHHKADTATASSATYKIAASQPIVRFNGVTFSPANYTIAVGKSIIFMNTSSDPLTVASDPSAQQTDHPEFNLSISPGTSKGVTITKGGIWGYYDQSKPTITGQVVVK